MADPSPESGPTVAPERSDALKAETRSVVRGVLLKRSREILANPGRFTADERGILQFGTDIFSVKNPEKAIEKKALDAKGTDLLMPALKDKTTDADGKPVLWEAGKVRIASIRGRDADGDILCTFRNIDDESSVRDSSGAILVLPITNEELFNTQTAAEAKLYGEITNANPVVASELQTLQHERGQGALPTSFPSEKEVADLKDQYSVTEEDMSESKEVKTPIERADATITDQIKMLEEALTKNPPDQGFAGKENRENAQRMLFNLLMADAAKGRRGVLIKADALQKLHDSGLPVGDFTEEIVALTSERLDASTMQRIDVENLIRDPDSGINSDKVIQELLDLYDEKGVLAFMQDKRVQKLSSITEPIMGEDFTPDVLIKLVKASQLKPEQKADLEEQIARGAKKDKILLLLLLLIGAPVISAAGAAVGSVELINAMAKNH